MISYLKKKLQKRFANYRGKLWLAGIAALVAAAPWPAFADILDINGILAGGVAWAAFGFSTMVDFILGSFILVESFLLQVMLAINVGLVNSPVVRVGFPISLSLANLAFVLGIIIIAISTILGMQNYGMKKLLWKLLVMAIAVNFGLVIAGMLLNFSDSITLYLVRATLPGSGQDSADGGKDLGAFAANFAGAFQPQKTKLLSPNDLSNQQEITDWQGAAQASGHDFGELIAPIAGIFLSIGVELVFLIVVGGLVVMLLLRYVQLGFLLIALPLAWAAWPFPALKKNFGDWWKKFLKQVFFPPIVVFALWLAIIVGQKLKDVGGTYMTSVSTLKAGSDSVYSGIVNFFGGMTAPVVDAFLTAAVMGLLSLMGIIAAQKFGIAVADNTLNAAKGVTSGAKRGALVYSKNRAERTKLRAQEGGARLGANLLKRFPVIDRNIQGGKMRVLLDNDRKPILRTVPLDSSGKPLKGLTIDPATKDWKKNAAGNFVDGAGNDISRDFSGMSSVPRPVTENGMILSRDLVDDKGRAKYAPYDKDGKPQFTELYVTKDGTLTTAPLIKNAAGLEGVAATAKNQREYLRGKAEASPGLLGSMVSAVSQDVIKGAQTGKHKGPKTRKELDAALASIGVHVPHDEGDHGGGEHGGGGGEHGGGGEAHAEEHHT